MTAAGRARVAAALVLAAAAAACGPSRSANDAASAPAEARKAPRGTDRAYPNVLSVSPDTITVVDGQLEHEHFDTSYSIDNPSLLKKLELEVYVPGFGIVQRMNVTDTPADDREHTIGLWLEARQFDLGPTVKFRVRCPSGDTDWMSLGHDRAARVQPGGQLPQLTAIAPPHTNRPSGQPGEAVLVTLFGRGFDKDCTPEGTVNGSSLEIAGSYVQEGAVHASIEYSSLGYRVVGERYLEIKLVAYSTGIPVETLAHVTFAE